MTSSTPQLSGSELRSRRLHAGLSRRELARLVGVDLDCITDWEAGDRPIDCSSALRQALATHGRSGEERERVRA